MHSLTVAEEQNCFFVVLKFADEGDNRVGESFCDW